MTLVIGIILGVLIGAGAVYMLLNGTITQQEQDIERHKRTISEMEQRHESRLRETIQSLQADYNRKVEQMSAEASQNVARQYETEIQSLKQKIAQSKATSSPPATASSPKQDFSAIAPTPQSTPQPTTSSSTLPSDEVSPETLPKSSAALSSASPDSARNLEALASPTTQTRPLQGLSVEQRQSLVSSVLTMGESKQPSHVPELNRLSTVTGSDVREATAIALKNIASSNPVNPVVQQIIPTLGKLSQDPDAVVRCAAVQALGEIPSYKVIPFVRRSLRDADMRVVKAATDAMGRFKYFQKSSTSTVKPKKKNFRTSSQPN